MPVERPREKTMSSAGAPRESTAVETLHELVAIHLLRTDQRYTAGRQAVIELLASFARPLSISEISEAIPEVPRSSAYRHLSDLERAGLVRRIAASDEFARFELAEDLTEHHHHLLCTSCGRVIDVTPTPAFEQTVAKMVQELAVQQDFAATSHALDVKGHCANCAHEM